RFQRLVDAIDNFERRGITVLDDAQEYGAPAVLAHHVLLHQPAVVDLANVLQKDGGPIRDLDRNVVEIIDAARRGIGANGVLGIADLSGTGRQGQVLRVDRIDNVGRGQALGKELRRIDVDHDLAVLAPGGRRQGDPGNRRQLLADAINAVVIELL